MLQLFRYRILSLLREKTTIFWSIAFALILATFFHFAFSGLGEDLKSISVAVVFDEAVNQTESESVVKSLKQIESNNKKLLHVKTESEEDAKRDLKNKKVKGIYYYTPIATGENPIRLCVLGSGLEESILQSVMESYNNQMRVYTTVMLEKPQKMSELMKFDYGKSMVVESTITGKEVQSYTQYFLALIGMACMFGCFIGMDSASKLQANVGALGARRCITSTSKAKLIFVDVFVAFFVQFISVLVLMAYIKGVLKIDLGNHIGYLVLIAALGSMIGVSLGMLVGSIGKVKEGAKIGILLTISLTSSFLSGLMVSSIKGTIEQNCPIINRINPSSLISDALYCVGVYEDMGRLQVDLLLMLLLVVLLYLGSFVMMRRVRYDNI
ncbi:aBC-2 type transporter [Clostridium sp. CAG:411]|jgi:ABC-2 type transport system permease protein|nr:ABC transporter permease [Lachnospiraceae bacterium]CDE47188.1 aBC-2 type transporter [Clostridium sp. CAG:411]